MKTVMGATRAFSSLANLFENWDTMSVTQKMSSVSTSIMSTMNAIMMAPGIAGKVAVGVMAVAGAVFGGISAH